MTTLRHYEHQLHLYTSSGGKRTYVWTQGLVYKQQSDLLRRRCFFASREHTQSDSSNSFNIPVSIAGNPLDRDSARRRRDKLELGATAG